MKLRTLLAIALPAVLTITTCVNPPDYPDTPVIEFMTTNKSEVFQGANTFPNDTLRIQFSFTDGDGDLSIEDSTDVFVYDTRFPTLPPNPYKIPAIPTDGTGNGIRGEITLNIPNKIENICCVENGFACPPNASVPTDTFSYEIQIRDRAGNFSNRIRTGTITILCQQ